MINKKYTSTKKNGGNIPHMLDERVKYVPVGCGYCMECRKAKAVGWRVRLNEELNSEVNKQNAKFITLTFNNDELDKLIHLTGHCESNAIATYAVRHFLERYRKKEKKSCKHWLITELGHKNSERIHLHGILWSDLSNEELQKIWKYGYIYIGKYVNEKSIKYITKYITKIDTDHKNYTPVILCSSGIGKDYVKNCLNKYKGEDTNERYRFTNGIETNLPIYYRNKLYTEEQREKLWLMKLDKGERWANGVKCEANDTERINKQLEEGRKMNKRLGFPTDDSYKKEEYNARLISLEELRKIRYKAWKEAKSEKEYYNLIKAYKQQKINFIE